MVTQSDCVDNHHCYIMLIFGNVDFQSLIQLHHSFTITSLAINLHLQNMSQSSTPPAANIITEQTEIIKQALTWLENHDTNVWFEVLQTINRAVVSFVECHLWPLPIFV